MIKLQLIDLKLAEDPEVQKWMREVEARLNAHWDEMNRQFLVFGSAPIPPPPSRDA